MYEIEIDTGLIWKRHVDHLKSLGTVVKEDIIPTSLEERPSNNQLSLLNLLEGIHKGTCTRSKIMFS